MRRTFHIFVWMTLLSGLAACNVTRKIPDGEYLLTRNRVRILRNDSIPKPDRVSRADMEQFIKQTPNKRILGFDFYLWLYNLSDTAKNNWKNRWLRRIGEEPVLLDTSLVRRSVRDMDLYLQSVGSFRSSVTDTIRTEGKRAEVDYTVAQSVPYRIGRLSYRFYDKFLEPIVLADTARSLIRPGQTYSRTALEEERQRIVRQLRDQGYYQFSPDNITYVADTAAGDRTVDLTMNVRQREAGIDKEGNIVYENHRVYRIREIIVNTQYDPMSLVDSTVRHRYDTLDYHGIRFLRSGRRTNLRPEVVSRAIDLYPNYLYNESEVKYTHARLVNLKFFRNVSILFSEAESDPENRVTYVGQGGADTLTTREGELVCTILCTPMLRQGYKIEGELSTNSNYTGLSLTVGYANKNAFRGAELFDVSVKGVYEFVHAKKKHDSYEIGASTSLTFPRLLLPFRLSRSKRLYNTGTKVEVSISKQRRPDYDRTLSNVSFGYLWSNGRYTNFIFRPIDVNYVKVPWVNQEFLDDIENPYLRNSYQSQLIAGLSASFIYNAQGSPRPVSAAFRLNVETNGNLIGLVSHLTGHAKEKTVEQNGGTFTERYYEIFGIRYAQYVRADLNLSYKFALGEKASLVWRIYAGGGYAYENTHSLPFERMFFAGGSNSMRGWQVRTLGPGNAPETAKNIFPNQVGNIKLETNLEGRFPVIGPLNGAVFFDLGNIWNTGRGNFPAESYFKFNRFYKQLGFNTGLGARFDFGFFLARLDWGLQLHNPDRPAGERWIHKFRFSNTALHFAIGYPF